MYGRYYSIFSSSKQSVNSFRDMAVMACNFFLNLVNLITSPVVRTFNNAIEYYHQLRDPYRDIYLGKCDHENTERDYLDVQMGREYRIVHRTNYNWWYAEDMILNTFGFIQLEYLVKHDDIAIQKWFHKISRASAEKVLMETRKPIGAFLVRPSEKNAQDYSLSVKVSTTGGNNNTVKHFRIQLNSETGRFFVGPHSKQYKSVTELINHIQSSKRIAIPLTAACPKIATPESRLSYLANASHCNSFQL